MLYNLTDIKKLHSDNEIESLLNKKCIKATDMNFDSEYEIISFTNLMNNELNTYPELVTSPDKQLHKTYEDMESLKTIPIGRTIVVPPGNAYLREDNEDDDILFFYQSLSNDTYKVRKSTFAELHLPLPTVFDIKYYDTTNDLLEVENMEIGVPETSPVDRYVYYTQKDIIVKFKHKDYIINFFKQQKKEKEETSPFIDKEYKDTLTDEYTNLTDQALYELSKIVLDEDDPEFLPNTRKMALHVIRKSKPGIPQNIVDYNTKVLNRQKENQSSELFPGDNNKHETTTVTTNKELKEVEKLLGMNIHELFDSIRYKKEKPVSAIPELDIDKMMHDIKNKVVIDNDTWAIFTSESMDMSKPYEMSGAPADSNSIEFDVYLGKLTVTTQGTYGYIYNRKTREQILCLKKDEYVKEIKRLFGIDMNSESDEVPNIVVNENGYKVASSNTGKSYIANIPDKPDNNTDTGVKDTTEDSHKDSYKVSNSDENASVDNFTDTYAGDASIDGCENSTGNIHNDNCDDFGGDILSDKNRVNSLKAKLDSIKSFEEEQAREAAEHEREQLNANQHVNAVVNESANEVDYGGYNSEVSYMKAHDEYLRKKAKEIPPEYINHCNIKQEDIDSESGDELFARYANMKIKVIPVPPESEQNVHVCEDIDSEGMDLDPDEDDYEDSSVDTSADNEYTDNIEDNSTSNDTDESVHEHERKHVEDTICDNDGDNQGTDNTDTSGNCSDLHSNEFMNKPISNDVELDTEEGNDVCSREESKYLVNEPSVSEEKVVESSHVEPSSIETTVDESKHESDNESDNLSTTNTRTDINTDTSPDNKHKPIDESKKTNTSTFLVSKSNNIPGQVDITVLDDEEYVKQELERDMSRINKLYNHRLINFNDMNIDTNTMVPKDENEEIVLNILKYKRKHSYFPTYPSTYKDYSNFFFNKDFYDNLTDELIDKIINADLDAMDAKAFNEFIADLPDKQKWIVRTAKLCYLYTGIKLFNNDRSINEAAKICTSDITNDKDNMFDEEGFEILIEHDMELARKHIVGGAKFLDKEECDMWIEDEKLIRQENEASSGK